MVAEVYVYRASHGLVAQQFGCTLWHHFILDGTLRVYIPSTAAAISVEKERLADNPLDWSFLFEKF